MTNLSDYQTVAQDNGLDTWVKPGGKEIQLNRIKATVELARSLEWMPKVELDKAIAEEAEAKKAKAAKATEETDLDELRAEYEKVIGEKPGRLGAAKMNAAIAEAQKAE